MPGLLLENIVKSFDGKVVLDNVSLELTEGELLVVLGPSGCGKSTLLRLIAGLETLDSGKIVLGEKRIDSLQPRERNIAMVFQNYALYPHMTVEKNLAFPLKIVGLKKSEWRQRVYEIAELLGLTNKLSSRPGQLSGGQRQRVALGRAIIRNPSVFLLDEPLSNLDADLRVRMRREIARIQHELKVTTIFVTHDQTEALTLADRIVVLHEGRVSQIGKPQELYSDPDNLFVAQFIGLPKLNIINAKITDNRLEPFGMLSSQLSAELSVKDVVVGIRPDKIYFKTDGQYKAQVISREFHGDRYIYKIDYEKIEFMVSDVKNVSSDGSQIRFSLDSADLLLFNPATGKRIR